MIAPQQTTPTLAVWFRQLRRSEIAIRRAIWRAIGKSPLSDDVKQFLSPIVQRDEEDAQRLAATVARATLQGKTYAAEERTTMLHDSHVSTLLVDSLLHPRHASHATIVFLVMFILVFGTELIANSGLRQEPESVMIRTATEMTLPIDTPLPQVTSASEITAPHMVTPLPSALPPFLFYHRIQRLDTLGSIAEQYNVSPKVLFWANGLQDGKIFIAGSTLRIPRLPGVSHTILEDETIDDIAREFSVPREAITLFRPNKVTRNEDLVVGKEVFIPYVVPDYPEAVLTRYGGEEGVLNISAIETVSVLENETNLRGGPGRAYDKIGVLMRNQRLIPIARYGSWIKLEIIGGEVEVGWVKGSLLGISDSMFAGLPTVRNVAYPPPRWVYPTTGQLTSRFGWRSVPFYSFHNGVDWANKAGTAIYAARYGRVIEAGWCRGYGYCVKIDHGGGVVTHYGHMLKRPVVSTGDVVDLGDYIGQMGSTYDASGGGYSSGVHLHFTVLVGGKAVDPLQYLP